MLRKSQWDSHRSGERERLQRVLRENRGRTGPVPTGSCSIQETRFRTRLLSVSAKIFNCDSVSSVQPISVCAERSRLLDIAASAIHRHSDLLKLMAELVAAVDHIKVFTAVSNKAEESYAEAKRAWDAYTRHIAEHGCAIRREDFSS